MNPAQTNPPVQKRPRSWASFLTQVRTPDASTCIAINLGAFPGLGTWIARRPFGIPQMMLSLTGFALAVSFMCVWIRELLVRLGSGSPEDGVDLSHISWMGAWGFGSFGVSWVWAGLSSLSLWRSARTPPPMPPPPDSIQPASGGMPDRE